MQAKSTICVAIRELRLLEFDYRGYHRIAAPYCHGTSALINEVVRAIQVGGASRSGHFGSGKLWIVDEMRNLRLTDEVFVPDDPHYNPNDSAIVRIHCRV